MRRVVGICQNNSICVWEIARAESTSLPDGGAPPGSGVGVGVGIGVGVGLGVGVGPPPEPDIVTEIVLDGLDNKTPPAATVLTW